MSRGLTLRKKTLLLAAGNCAFLLLVFGAFLSLQFRQDVRLALFAPMRDRAVEIGRRIAMDLRQTPPAERDALIARYAAAERLKLYLFRNDDLTQLGGPRIQLPPTVARLVRGVPGRPPLRPPLLGETPLPGTPPMFVTTDGPVRYWIGIRTTITSPEAPTLRPGTLLFGFASIWDIPFLTEAWIWLGIIGGTMLLSVLLWLPLVRGVTRTITRMTQATAAIADGQFDTRVDMTRTDELGSLTRSINRMAEQLESFVRGQRRFLGDVAHEVRSPLGRMQVASEILEQHAGPETARYVSDLKEDVELMSTLTEQLLMFAKGDLRPDAIRLVPTPVLDVVTRAVQVETDGHDIRVDVDPGLTVLAHPDTSCARSPTWCATPSGTPARPAPSKSPPTPAVTMCASRWRMPDQACPKRPSVGSSSRSSASTPHATGRPAAPAWGSPSSAPASRRAAAPSSAATAGRTASW